jgi:hypothetical protein
MTRLRKMMLEELQRRNFAESTTEAYIRALTTKGVLSLSVSALGCGNIMLNDESHTKHVVRGRPNAGEADSPICWKR